MLHTAPNRKRQPDLLVETSSAVSQVVHDYYIHYLGLTHLAEHLLCRVSQEDPPDNVGMLAFMAKDFLSGGRILNLAEYLQTLGNPELSNYFFNPTEHDKKAMEALNLHSIEANTARELAFADRGAPLVAALLGAVMPLLTNQENLKKYEQAVVIAEKEGTTIENLAGLIAHKL